MKGVSGPWLADIAANVLAITVVVLIVLARLTPETLPTKAEQVLVARPVQPLGGAEAVELLRQRVLPDGAAGIVDLGPDMGALPPGVRVLMVLDPSAYPTASAELAARGQGWQELTVPQALKTADNRWHPDFLALAEVAGDPDRFRAALQDLLARSGPALAAKGGGAAPSRLEGWVAVALDLLGLTALAAALWGLARLRRAARA